MPQRSDTDDELAPGPGGFDVVERRAEVGQAVLLVDDRLELAVADQVSEPSEALVGLLCDEGDGLRLREQRPRQLSEHERERTEDPTSFRRAEEDPTALRCQAATDLRSGSMRNAVDHGIEPVGGEVTLGKPSAGQVRLRFFQQGNTVVVECSDDGRGLDYQRIRETAVAKGLLGRDAEAAEIADQLAAALEVADVEVSSSCFCRQEESCCD